MRAWMASAGLAVLALLVAPAASFSLLYLDPVTGDDQNSGLSPSLPLATIGAALNLVTGQGSSSTVGLEMADGTYYHTSEPDPVSSPVYLQGNAGDPSLVVVIANATLMDVSGTATAVLEGITFTNTTGSALISSSSSSAKLTIRQCVFSRLSSSGALINVNADELDISDSTFSGGAHRMVNSQCNRNNITRCHFSDITTTASGQGGLAIKVQVTGTASVTNSTFRDISSNSDGTVQLRGSSSSNTITLTARDLTFDNTKGRDGSGLYVRYADHTIERVVGRNSQLGDDGHLFLRDSRGTVDSCEFTDNVGSSGTLGGAIYILSCDGDTSITNSVFRRNSASSGGHVYASSMAHTLTISDSVFEDGSADSGAHMRFSGSGSSDLAVLTNVTITGGVATDGAGAIRASLSLSLYNVTMSNNEGAPGALEMGSETLIVERSTFHNNTHIEFSGLEGPEYFGGGAMYIGSSTSFTITDSTFTDNTVTANQGGGAILALSLGSADRGVIERTTFTGNSALEGRGGALLILGSDAQTVSDFYNSSPEYYYEYYYEGMRRRSFRTEGATGVLQLISVTIEGNSAGEEGSGMFVDGSMAMTGVDVRISDNTLLPGVVNSTATGSTDLQIEGGDAYVNLFVESDLGTVVLADGALLNCTNRAGHVAAALQGPTQATVSCLEDWAVTTPSASPSGRAFAASAMRETGELLMVHGGASVTSGVQSDLWEYAFETQTWTVSNSSGPDRWMHAMGVHADEFFVAFGQTADGNLATTALSLVYGGESWALVPSGDVTPTPRSAPAYATWNGTLVVFGGRAANGTVLTALEMLDMGTTTWRASAAAGPSARAFAALAVYADTLYLTGGLDGTGAALNDLWAYAPGPDSWTEVVTATGSYAARLAHQALVSGVYLYIVGGRDGDIGATGSLVTSYLSFDTMEWADEAASSVLTGQTAGTTSAAWNGTIVQVLGHDLGSRGYPEDVYTFAAVTPETVVTFADGSP